VLCLGSVRLIARIPRVIARAKGTIARWHGRIHGDGKRRVNGVVVGRIRELVQDRPNTGNDLLDGVRPEELERKLAAGTADHGLLHIRLQLQEYPALAFEGAHCHQATPGHVVG